METRVEKIGEKRAESPAGINKWQWRQFLPGLGGFFAAVAVCVVWAVCDFASLHAAWLYVRGARIVVEPATINLPAGEEGETREVALSFHNLTGQPVSIIGATTSCTCVSVGGQLPVAIPPRESKALRLSLQLGPPSAAQSETTVTYYTDHPAAPNIVVKVTNRAVDF